ncbi:hypothetical protein [Chromobacterium violaceum]|uniref:hypothetical protein n=1 Tax=Chromobacterium violaceum TaxID=536 RepID=UPI000AF2A015|nr:hypothetical protein [Chromobacterium violaceum]
MSANLMGSFMWKLKLISALLGVISLMACSSGYMFDPVRGVNYKVGELTRFSFSQANRSNDMGFFYELYRLDGSKLHEGDADIYSRGGSGFGSSYIGGVFPKPGSKVKIRWKAYPIHSSLSEIDLLPWSERIVPVEGGLENTELPVVGTVMCSPFDVHVYVFGQKESLGMPYEIKSRNNPFYWACDNKISQ